jgi:osmoprotectant transport system permease protein
MNPSEILSELSRVADISSSVLRHLYLSFMPVLAATALALPIGLYIGHRRRFEFAAVQLANLGRAVPSFAILSLAFVFFVSIQQGFSIWPTFTALFFLSLPPILINAHIGVKSVDAEVIESARGMGLSEFQILTRIELPLAAPLIVTGVRTAAVQSVATATLGALVAAGGVGFYIVYGFRTNNLELKIGGALLVALLALATEIALGLLARAVSPKGAPRVPSRVEPMEQPAQVGRTAGAFRF